MKKYIITFLFLVFLFIVTWIDVSDHVKIPSPYIDVTLFGKHIQKDFKPRLGLDLKGGSHLVFEADTSDISVDDRKNAIEGARDIIERRINYFGVSEPNVQTVQSGNIYRILVDVPTTTKLSDAVSLIGQTAQLEFTEQSSPEAQLATDTPVFMQVTKKTGLTGKHVKKAQVQFDQQGKPSVGLVFNDEGAKLFAEITERNVGKPIGIFIDGFPITNPPIVQQAITGGEAVITGNFSVEDANKLAISINSGALPVSVKLVEQRTIGPTLGEKQIQLSVFAGVVGLLTVILFMVIYYGRLGMIAVMALIIYGLISYAIFRIIPIVLTLPGIAGFILSIGMAVDSNILIFERIKEEVRKGTEFKVAIKIGFGRAIDAIKDANITTLLVAFILFNPLNWDFFPQFGLVRGFALTLAVGVITSLFTGVFITRKLIDIFYRHA